MRAFAASDFIAAVESNDTIRTIDAQTTALAVKGKSKLIAGCTLSGKISEGLIIA